MMRRIRPMLLALRAAMVFLPYIRLSLTMPQQFGGAPRSAGRSVTARLRDQSPGRFRVWRVLLCCVLLILASQTPGHAQEPRSLSISPESGPAGTRVTVRGTGWDPEYYSSGVQISFDQNFGNGVLTPYADEMTVKPDQDGRFRFEHTIPENFSRGDVLSISGLIGNGSGERANFTVIGDGRGSSGTSDGPDLQPTAITYDPADARLNTSVHFDSGITNSGAQGSGTFNIKWFVDGKEVEA